MNVMVNKKYMFFWKLPISFNCLNENIYLSRHVYVAKNAQEIISQIQEIQPAIAHAIYAQYGIPGLGCQHRLLCADLNLVDSKQARKEMWEVLAILRLVKPIPIHITGSVEIAEEGINGFETWWHQTHLNISNRHSSDLEYTLSDIQSTKMLWNSFFNEQADKKGRLRNALDSFIRVTLTEPIAFAETFFQKLFPILDLLCGNPPARHGREIKSNLGIWLQHVYCSETLEWKIDFEKVMGNLWDWYRNHYLHKSISVLPASHLYIESSDGNFTYTGKNPDDDNIDAAIALHEVVRLCLLSFLLIPQELQNDFDKLPLVEAHKSSSNRGDADAKRRDAVRTYFKNLIEKKVLPSKKFWLPDFHEQLFQSFSG